MRINSTSFTNTRTLLYCTLITLIIFTVNLEDSNAAETVGNLKSIYSSTGKICLSVDGGASNQENYTIKIKRPNDDAFVKKSFLFGTSTNKPNDTDLTTNYDIRLNSNLIEWHEPVVISTIQNHLDQYECKPVTPYTRNFFNMYADVTHVIQNIDLKSGINSVAISQVKKDSSKIIQGCVLIVVFENPHQVEDKTIRILFSNNNDQPFGTEVPINYRFEIPLTGFNFYNQDSYLNMGLGISNGCQPKIACLKNQCNPSEDSLYGIHSTVVKVNGQLLSSLAGGQDDGDILGEIYDHDGEGLLSVGGINDDTQNPDINVSVDNETDARSDDELYSLKHFVHDNMTEIVVTTENQSKNDNLFLAYVEYSYAPDSSDRDNDGVINEWDRCNNTHHGACTDNEGCDCRLKIISDFENGLDEWTQSGGTITYQDGYITLTDKEKYDYMYMSAPQKFLGDLTSFNNGILSFDANLIQTTDQEEPFVHQFGIITLTSATGKQYTLDIAQSNPIELIPPSTKYDIKLNATVWNVEDNEWIQLLSNVSSIYITLESIDNLVETMGFDNFLLQSKVCLTQTDIENIAEKSARRERIKWDVNGDNEYGLEDVIYYLEMLSGVSDNDKFDSDGDGVIDSLDECKHTPPGLCKNNKGCLCDVYFSDNSPQCSTIDQLNLRIGQSVDIERSKWDILNDNKIGLPEVIRALKEIGHLNEISKTWYKDIDGDKYSDGTTAIQWDRPDHYYLRTELSDTSGDCDDNDPGLHPKTLWYQDHDNDKYSNGMKKEQCVKPSDYYDLPNNLTAISGDCDDSNPDLHPKTLWYKDVDKDGYSDGINNKQQCTRPEISYELSKNLKDISGDCNDNDPNLHPKTLWYKDHDNDNYSNGANKEQCVKPSDDYSLPANLTAISGDCDDSDQNIHPGAEEICDGKDNDCDKQLKTIYIYREWVREELDNRIFTSEFKLQSGYERYLGEALCEDDSNNKEPILQEEVIPIYSCAAHYKTVYKPFDTDHPNGKTAYYIRDNCFSTVSPLDSPRKLETDPIFYLYKNPGINRKHIVACFQYWYKNTFETEEGQCQTQCDASGMVRLCNVSNELEEEKKATACQCEMVGEPDGELGYTHGY